MSHSTRPSRLKPVDRLTEKLAFSLEPPAAAKVFLDLALEHSGSAEGAVLLLDPSSGSLAACPASQGTLHSRVEPRKIQGLARGKGPRTIAARGRTRCTGFPLRHEGLTVGCLLLSGVPRKPVRAKIKTLAACYARHVARSLPPAPAQNSADPTGRLIHDFRNIVAGLSGYAQLLRRHAGKLEGKSVEEYAGIIEREADRLGRMAEAHLRSLRGDPSSPRAERRIPAATIGDVYALMAADLQQRGIHLLIRIESERAVAADPDLLQRALVNLLVNAREALPQGGIIEIAAENAGPNVEFRVSDSGPGIPEEVAARLFLSPVTLGKPKGNGLGLRIVKEIADCFHGSVRIEPSPFGGATIVLSLPA